MKALWRIMGAAVPDRGWFWTRFVEAAEAEVERWAPAWARTPFCGRPLGVWALLGVWVGLPMALVFAL